MEPRTHELPKVVAAEKFTLDELLDTTARLREILATETQHLRQMKIKELGALQREKERLTTLLESYQLLLKKDPHALGEISAAMREEIELEMDDFTVMVEENYRRVAVARAVNQRIVQAILDVITEQQHAGTYTKQGMSAAPNMALSFNLNQKA